MRSSAHRLAFGLEECVVRAYLLGIYASRTDYRVGISQGGIIRPTHSVVIVAPNELLRRSLARVCILLGRVCKLRDSA